MLFIGTQFSALSNGCPEKAWLSDRGGRPHAKTGRHSGKHSVLPDFVTEKSVCNTEQLSGSDSDNDDPGSPRRVYRPVCSADPTPETASVSSGKKDKVNKVHVAESRARAIERCTTPEELVRRIVYEGLLPVRQDNEIC